MNLKGHTLSFLSKTELQALPMSFFFVLQLRLRGMNYSQVAQLKDLFDKEILTRDQFEKEREKLVNELAKVE